MRLENWSVVAIPDNPYQAPELIRMRIHGEVYGNPRFTDGELVTTSSVQKIEGKNIYTLNSVYELGTPSAEYVQWCKDNNTYVPTDEVPIRFVRS